ncbi:MAG: hypothetical protein J7K53_06510 [Bacteroidales bacterium]|nr:hypothetical protein [Bacteroidales bacterium]
MQGYSDENKLTEEVTKAGILLDIAGTPHVCQEDWNDHIQKMAVSQLSRKKSGKSLADTDQMGIINSNLKRLPESIRSKERKLKANQALLKDATTDSERYTLRGDISRLKNEIGTHQENLKRAKTRQKQLLDLRSAELDAMESEDNKNEELAGSGTSDK